MSTWREIVRYRANMKAVFYSGYDQKRVRGEKQLNERRKKSEAKIAAAVF